MVGSASTAGEDQSSPGEYHADQPHHDGHDGPCPPVAGAETTGGVGAMAVLVLFVTLGYYGATQGYLKNRFEDYFKEKTTKLFEIYYKERNHSWEGIEEMKLSDELERRNPDQREIALLSPDGSILFFAGPGDPGSLIQRGKRSAVIVNGTTVGTIYVDRWESTEDYLLKKYILDSMRTSSFRVPILTGIVALFLGIWLTMKLTQPLNRLIPAIQKIAAGELHTRSRDPVYCISALCMENCGHNVCGVNSA